MIITAILTGKIAPLPPTGEPSAIFKAPAHGPRVVHWLGIEGDAQADLSVHGGPDKAIHHYPYDHYAFWRESFGPLPTLEEPGGFGENISTTGLTEDTACIGDRYRLGTALVEISQGRQPCYKQAARTGKSAIVAQMVKTRRCGWYYRVLEEGRVEAGSTLNLSDRPHPDWTVARVIGLLLGKDGKNDPAALRALTGLNVLAEAWRVKAGGVRAKIKW
jgi:MOSC domain-containing protein YiiM